MAASRVPVATLMDVEDRLSITMNRKRCAMDTPLPRIIQRIPPVFRNPDPGAFDPKIVSIGPLHRGKEELQPMEESKWRFFDDLIRRSPQNSADTYVKAARSLEGRARQCYSQQVIDPLNSDVFVEMMVLDGCFILEYMIKSLLLEDVDIIPNTRTSRRDLLLLENQIPYFLLQSFFDVSDIPQFQEMTDSVRQLWLNRVGIRVVPITLTKLATCFVTLGKASEVTDPDSIHHLFHLFYLSICPAHPGERVPHRPQPKPWYRKLGQRMGRMFFYPFLWFLSLFLHNPRRLSRRYSYAWRKLHSATELLDAGVKFYPKGRDGLLDITFSWDDGALEIPPLPVSSATYPGFRNLSVFEKLYHLPGKYINSYLLLWTLLIKTPEDVALLQASGVLGNAFGKGEEVAALFDFNEASYASFERNYYMPVIKEMQIYCRDETRWWMTSLMNDYFSNPWTMISVIAAILLLILSLLQTFFSFYRFFHPRH